MQEIDVHFEEVDYWGLTPVSIPVFLHQIGTNPHTQTSVHDIVIQVDFFLKKNSCHFEIKIRMLAQIYTIILCKINK